MPLFNNFPYTNFHEMNLDWVIKKVKEIDQISKTVSELLGRYNAMFNKVTELSTEFDSFDAQMQANFEQYAQEAAQYITSELNNFNTLLNEQAENYDRQLAQRNSRLANIENTVIRAADMESPFTGETVPVQQVIYELASLHTTDALTAGEYDAAELSAAAYDALQLTAYQYDWNGSTYIN